MGKLNFKHENLCKALERLKEVIVVFDNFKSKTQDTYDVSLYRIFRDSMIQRFEFCVDLYWKYIKYILEKNLIKDPEYLTPKLVIKAACNARLITEEDAEVMLQMIDDRNRSSYIYKEEMAEQISSAIKKYFQVMKSYLEKFNS